MGIERSAGCVVFKETKKGNEFLLLKGEYKKEYWGFPKGWLEPNESKQEAALREVKEETDLDVKIMPNFKEEYIYFYKREGETIRKEVTYFLAQLEKGEAKKSWEHKDIKWFNSKQALEKVTHKTDKQILEKAIDFLKQKRLG